MRFKKILILGKEALLLTGLLNHLKNQGKLIINNFDGIRIDDIVSEINVWSPDTIPVSYTHLTLPTKRIV